MFLPKTTNFLTLSTIFHIIIISINVVIIKAEDEDTTTCKPCPPCTNPPWPAYYYVLMVVCLGLLIGIIAIALNLYKAWKLLRAANRKRDQSKEEHFDNVSPIEQLKKNNEQMGKPGMV